MRIRIYSDLHAEFRHFDPPPLDAGVDLVILAGDINKKARGVKWANETFACQVAYILGNHEYYDGHIDRTLQKMQDAAAGHVHVLENQILELAGVRVLGTMSWTVDISNANTGDDFEHLGLSICPDIDTLTYVLAGLDNPVTGWGRRDETWSFMDTPPISSATPLASLTDARSGGLCQPNSGAIRRAIQPEGASTKASPTAIAAWGMARNGASRRAEVAGRSRKCTTAHGFGYRELL